MKAIYTKINPPRFLPFYIPSLLPPWLPIRLPLKNPPKSISPYSIPAKQKAMLCFPYGYTICYFLVWVFLHTQNYFIINTFFLLWFQLETAITLLIAVRPFCLIALSSTSHNYSTPNLPVRGSTPKMEILLVKYSKSSAFTFLKSL